MASKASNLSEIDSSHSTAVAFALHTWQPRIRFMVFPSMCFHQLIHAVNVYMILPGFTDSSALVRLSGQCHSSIVDQYWLVQAALQKTSLHLQEDGK